MQHAVTQTPRFAAHPRRLGSNRRALAPSAPLPALPARRRRHAAAPIAASLSPAVPLPLQAATAVASRMAVSAARAFILVAAAGAAATVAALVATGAWVSTTASHPAVWAVAAALLGARLAAHSTRADARRLRAELAGHSETLAGIERGVAILYGSLDNLSHLHLETARRTSALAAELDVALAVLLEDRYEAFRAAVEAHERAQRAAAAARLWGSDGGGPGDALGGPAASSLAGRQPEAKAAPPAGPPTSPLAGLSPEARAAAVSDRLAALGSALGALAVASWVVGEAAAGRCVDGSGSGAAASHARRPGGAVLALPAPAGATCVPLEEGGDAAFQSGGPLWRRLAWAAGALRGKKRC